MTKLIVGLGNPGPEYEATRHNAGFWFIEQIARQAQVALRAESRFHGLATRAILAGQEVWLLTPQTYMNRSGQAVAALARFFKIVPEHILVVHDELDLPPGSAKLKRGGGTGGHNGLKDISAHLGTPNYWRLRLGIGHPRDNRASGETSNHDAVVNFVLKAPRKEEQDRIDEAMSHSLTVLPWIMRGEMEQAMMRLHNSRPTSGQA